jgi:hypothetical protein
MPTPLALGLVLVATVATHAPAQSPACGVERWNAKVQCDLDAAAVVRHPEPSTITALIGIPKEPDRPHNGRTPFERRVFRVRGIILEQRPVQADGDIHLVLGDPADRTRFLVAEIPDSACALGSRYASDFAESRRTFVTLPVGIEIEVEGVASWDDDHGQLGAAPNDIELHPVLRIVPVLNRDDLVAQGIPHERRRRAGPAGQRPHDLRPLDVPAPHEQVAQQIQVPKEELLAAGGRANRARVSAGCPHRAAPPRDRA